MMLGKRLLTILFLLPLLYFFIQGGERYLTIFLLILAGLALWEYYSLFLKSSLPFLVGFLICVAFLIGPVFPWPFWSLFLTTSLLILFLYVFFCYQRQDFMIQLGITLSGSIYIGWLLRYPILLLQKGTSILYLALFITWANDIFAYLVGSKWGKRRLAPSLSPKKSLEGALGGLAGAFLVGIVMGPFIGLSFPGQILVSLLGGISGQLGDLFESRMKRASGVKDSGRIFPGHGGVLDRIDSLLFSLPVIYYLLALFL